MNSLYESGIKGKIYRLIFELNKNNVMQIQTGSGTTDPFDTGENVAQGSIGGGLISARNIDKTINDQFKQSPYETSYINLIN